MTPAKRPKPAASKPTRTAAKKATAKPSATKKTAAKKTAARKTPARSTQSRKAAAKKQTAKKSAAPKRETKTTPARPAASKAMAKRPPGDKKAASRGMARPAAAVLRPPPSRPARPAKLDKETLAAIHTQLETEKTELEERLRELEEESFVGTQSEITGEVGLDEDFADAGTATFERERDLSIRNNIRDLIDQISRALVRIDEGTYGTCERCGRPIDAARLKALPHALLCMDCKRREERAR